MRLILKSKYDGRHRVCISQLRVCKLALGVGVLVHVLGVGVLDVLGMGMLVVQVLGLGWVSYGCLVRSGCLAVGGLAMGDASVAMAG